VKQPLTWYRLRWPREVTPEQVTQACRLLSSVAGVPVVVEAVGFRGRVEHRLALSKSRAYNVVYQLRAAIPGLAVERYLQRPALAVDRAVEVRLSTRYRSLRTDELHGISRTRGCPDRRGALRAAFGI
jgi:hypothetical protein